MTPEDLLLALEGASSSNCIWHINPDVWSRFKDDREDLVAATRSDCMKWLLDMCLESKESQRAIAQIHKANFHLRIADGDGMDTSVASMSSEDAANAYIRDMSKAGS
jgi:hypothetical protein